MTQPRVEPRDNNEAALIAQAAAGDHVAFGELVTLHENEVFTLALRLTGDWNRANDVAQEAFIRAWKALPRFRGDARFSTWIHRITVNAAWTNGSKRKRHAERTTPLEAISAQPVSRLGRPEVEGERMALRARLEGALDRLSPEQRMVVVLKDIEGWTHDEIAAEAGITVTAAKVRLHRARTKLRTMLWDEGSGR
ncbi:MAG: sigma-70 family RNA polymerase sigma factor [Acidimicrobiia bacterium]|nr:sigma-70 family RNA polymerase sigma factor [Acidimicrobiia bacterium]NNC76061.1 sigma-70 family RNA polymerase sigma factor [Acidimicrobiia bacterium]